MGITIEGQLARYLDNGRSGRSECSGQASGSGDACRTIRRSLASARAHFTSGKPRTLSRSRTNRAILDGDMENQVTAGLASHHFWNTTCRLVEWHSWALKNRTIDAEGEEDVLGEQGE